MKTELNSAEASCSLGWSKNQNKVCYNAGDCVITANGFEGPSNMNLAEMYHLDVDSNYSEEDAINSAFEIMNINFHYCSVLFCAGVLGVLRQPVIEAGIKPTGALYVVGESQTGKTTATVLCTKLYNRHELFTDTTVEIARVNSSSAAIEAMAEECKDCAFILDDLFRNSDSKEKREAERTVRNMLRNFADNSPRRTMHSCHAVNSQLIITGEYVIDNISDVGRCLILHIEDTITGTRLSEAQRKPLALSTFYYFFIKYICSHYNETVDFIIDEFNAFRNKSHTHLYHYERVYETAFLLKCMFKIVCRYAMDKKIFTEDIYNDMLDQISSVLDSMIIFHNNIVSIKKANNNELDLARALVYLIQNDIIYVGEKGDNCFYKNGYLYITNSEIIRALRSVYALDMSAKKYHPILLPQEFPRHTTVLKIQKM